jgi:ATP phosphoribosyltransferase regulatory subunit
MERISIGNPLGFRDILFDEAKRRRSIEQKLSEAFDHRAYREICTAGVEYFDVYQRGNQSIKDRVFRFLDRDDQLLALRADFTPAIARVVTTRLTQADLPVRVWYCGNVFRKVQPNRGLFRETTQVGAELLGVNSARSDAEILSLALDCLHTLGISDFKVHLNHAGIFRGIVNASGLDERQLQLLQSVIDRKDARGVAARLRETGVSTNIAAQLESLSRYIGGEEILDEAEQLLTSSESQAALGELRQLNAALREWKSNITFDLTEIDEMEYYTGIMFNFFSPTLRGELGGGGRYDDLLKEFGKAMPAVGFSFSLESLVELV